MAADILVFSMILSRFRSETIDILVPFASLKHSFGIVNIRLWCNSDLSLAGCEKELFRARW